jgi:predicted PurR-regulated permease PerM
MVAATDAVALAVTAVATLVVVALLAAAWYVLRAVRELRRQAEQLSREAGELLADIRSQVLEAGAEVDRVERMVGSAEAISDAVGQASRLVGSVVVGPLIKVVAFVTGVGEGYRSLRQRSRKPARQRRALPRRPRRIARGTRALKAGGR